MSAHKYVQEAAGNQRAGRSDDVTAQRTTVKEDGIGAQKDDASLDVDFVLCSLRSHSIGFLHAPFVRVAPKRVW